MPPEDYIGLEQEEYHRRVDAVVEEMKALNISSIVIIQDSVSIGIGDSVTPKSKFPGEVNEKRQSSQMED